MKRMSWVSLIISLAVSLGVGGLSALLTSGSMDQYEMMYRPPLSPPAFVFPVAWTILYILMGIAAYRIYISDAPDGQKKKALALYGIQLAVNFLWPLIFFELNAYYAAFVWLVFLWYLIYRMIITFDEIDRTAAILLLPYLIWVTFAGYLNLLIALN